MTKEGTTEKTDLFGLIEKSGGRISIGTGGEPRVSKVDLTKVRYLANFSKRSVIFGDLGMTMLPGDIVDLKKMFTESLISTARSLRDALVREVPLVSAYEDTDEGRMNLQRDAGLYFPEPSPLEKAKEEVTTSSSEGMTVPEEAITEEENPFQKELEEEITKSEEGVILGETSGKRTAGRNRPKSSKKKATE